MKKVLSLLILLALLLCVKPLYSSDGSARKRAASESDLNDLTCETVALLIELEKESKNYAATQNDVNIAEDKVAVLMQRSNWFFDLLQTIWDFVTFKKNFGYYEETGQRSSGPYTLF